MNLTKTPSPMNTLRTLHSATRFGGGGAILIVGGLDQNGNPLASAEIFYPATGAFVALAASSTRRDTIMQLSLRRTEPC